MARLVIINGLQQGRVLRLRSGINRIGRSVENHLQVPDPSISSAHCEVIYSDSSILIRDLNSTNGTFIDGEQIQEGNIRLGQALQIGNVELRVEEPALSSELTSVSVPDLPGPHPPASMPMPDGSASCANHPERAAVYRCAVCQQSLCETCVRLIRRVSGGLLVFCSLCAGACEPITPPPEQPEAPSTTQRRSFLGRLTQTLRLPFTRKRD